MSRDVQIVDDRAVSNTPNAIAQKQEGNDNTQIGYAQNVNVQQNIAVFVSDERDDEERDIIDIDFEAAFFNLFVVDVDKVGNKGSFTISKEESLSECMAQDLSDDVLRLTDTGKEFLKTLPCLFAPKNKRHNEEWKHQKAKIGIITKIDDNPTNEIRIEYRTFNHVPQFLINESREHLSIEGRPRYNELDNQHWTVKKVNLLGALKELGFSFKIFMS